MTRDEAIKLMREGKIFQHRSSGFKYSLRHTNGKWEMVLRDMDGNVFTSKLQPAYLMAPSYDDGWELVHEKHVQVIEGHFKAVQVDRPDMTNSYMELGLQLGSFRREGFNPEHLRGKCKITIETEE